MTKKDFITLLREDMLYQRRELSPNAQTIIKINGFALQNLRTIKLKLGEYGIAIRYKQNGVHIPVAFVYYDGIHTIGYKYRNPLSLELRRHELIDGNNN